MRNVTAKETHIGPSNKIKQFADDDVAWYCTNFYVAASEGEIHIRQWKNHKKYSQKITSDIDLIYSNYINNAERMIKETGEKILNTNDWFLASTEFMEGEIFMAIALNKYIEGGSTRYEMLDSVKYGYLKVRNTAKKSGVNE
jgi:hypothetical protein